MAQDDLLNGNSLSSPQALGDRCKQGRKQVQLAYELKPQLLSK